MRRGLTAVTAAIALALVLPGQVAAREAIRARPWWIGRLDTIAGDRPISVALGDAGSFWYRRLAARDRPPASNEKLLLSMTLLDRLGPGWDIATRAMTAGNHAHGVVRGNLWLVGAGDPETGRNDLRELADRVASSGIRKIRGSVVGATGPFSRDWWAPGWRHYFPRYYIALPTALTFRHNTEGGRHVSDPELYAARYLTKRLRAAGVTVRRPAGADRAPGGLQGLARIRSVPLEELLRHMNQHSRNFWAEVLGKRLGLIRSGRGSIAAGAAAIESFVRSKGQTVVAHDASGLSYKNRADAQTIVRLLWAADAEPWGSILKGTLAHGGVGTLEDRFTDVKIRAKTGTLEDVSALSGWIWLERDHVWAEFSIMSSNMREWNAKVIEDRAIEWIAAHATQP